MTAPAWQDVAITPTCSTPPDKGTIKLPNDKVIPFDKVLVRKKGASVVLSIAFVTAVYELYKGLAGGE